MSKVVKRHDVESARIHIETPDERFFRLMNTKIRHLRRTGGSTRITIPPSLRKRLGLEEGDPVKLFVFRSIDDLESVKDYFRSINGGNPFIVMIKWMWGDEDDD